MSTRTIVLARCRQIVELERDPWRYWWQSTLTRRTRSYLLQACRIEKSGVIRWSGLTAGEQASVRQLVRFCAAQFVEVGQRVKGSDRESGCCPDEGQHRAVNPASGDVAPDRVAPARRGNQS